MPPGGRSKDEDQRFLQTLQVRVRKKNPPIERQPEAKDRAISSETPEGHSDRDDSVTLALPQRPEAPSAKFRDGSETVASGDQKTPIELDVEVLPRGESETLALGPSDNPAFAFNRGTVDVDDTSDEGDQLPPSSLPTERPTAQDLQDKLTRKAADRASTKAERSTPISSHESSEAGSSLYDRIQDTDRANDLAQAEQELMQALEHYGHDDGALAEETQEAFQRPAPADRAQTAPVAPEPVPQQQYGLAATETFAADLDETLQEAGPARAPRRKAKTKAKAARRDRTARTKRGRQNEPEAEVMEVPTEIPFAPPARVSELLEEDETVVGLPDEPLPDAMAPATPDSDAPHPDGMIRVIRKKVVSTQASDDKDQGLQPEDFPEVQPKGRFSNLGTDAAGAALMEHAMQARSADLVDLKHAPVKLYRGQISDEKLLRLDDILSGDFDLGLDGTHSPKRALERLINERDFNELPTAARAGLLASVGSEPADVTSIKALLALVKTGALARMKEAAQRQTIELLSSVAAEARVRIAHLAARQLRGQSALEDYDLQNVSIIDHISALCMRQHESPLLSAAGYDGSRIASLVLGTLASPERMSFEEGTPGVLGMFEFGLADTAPAEFARLWRQIAFSSAVIELPSGATLDMKAELTEENKLSAKQTPLRVALKGLAALARPHGRSRRPTFIMPGGHGVDADVIAKSLNHLFGVSYGVFAGASAALRTLDRAPKEPRRMPPIYVSVLYRRGERLFVFDHMDESHVYLRAPHGKSSKTRGKVRPDPEREVFDPDGALDRIPRDEFEENVGIVLVPRN